MHDRLARVRRGLSGNARLLGEGGGAGARACLGRPLGEQPQVAMAMGILMARHGLTESEASVASHEPAAGRRCPHK